MSVQPLTIQAYLHGSWQDIAQLDFNDNKKLSDFSYFTDYGLAHFLADNHFATSINYPVELFSYDVDNGWLPSLRQSVTYGLKRRYQNIMTIHPKPLVSLKSLIEMLIFWNMLVSMVQWLAVRQVLAEKRQNYYYA